MSVDAQDERKLDSDDISLRMRWRYTPDGMWHEFTTTDPRRFQEVYSPLYQAFAKGELTSLEVVGG